MHWGFQTDMLSAVDSLSKACTLKRPTNGEGVCSCIARQHFRWSPVNGWISRPLTSLRDPPPPPQYGFPAKLSLSQNSTVMAYAAQPGASLLQGRPVPVKCCNVW